LNGLQENLKGQEAAGEEVRAEFQKLLEQCRDQVDCVRDRIERLVLGRIDGTVRNRRRLWRDSF
jgi:hypothetical protein